MKMLVEKIFPLSRLPRDGRQARERSSLFVIDATEFGHCGDDLVGSQCSDASDADKDFMTEVHQDRITQSRTI